MKFHFSGQILSENGELKINIPFNVWEVCDSQGVLMISVNAMGLSWECNLTPLGKGYYTIPVTEQQAEQERRSDRDTWSKNSRLSLKS